MPTERRYRITSEAIAPATAVSSRTIPTMNAVSSTGLSTASGLSGFSGFSAWPGIPMAHAAASTQKTHRHRGEIRRPLGNSRNTTA
jgi:hypothetical protein